MNRPMNSAEKIRFRHSFPNLDVDQAVVTNGPSMVYNCIAWTVGLVDRWLWPGNALTDFDTFYRAFAFVRAGDGTIAAWGRSSVDMTHGSVSGPGHGPRWESKCGADLRIQHGLDELAGSSYGRVVAFYRKAHGNPTTTASLAEALVKENFTKSYVNAAQRRELAEARDRIPAKLRKDYDRAFAAWKSTWFSGGLAMSSDPHTRAVGGEYDALIALGPAIIPLVVESLADPDNFMVLQLYDAIQPNHRLLVQFEPGDERILEGEQGRARRVVQTWFANR